MHIVRSRISVSAANGCWVKVSPIFPVCRWRMTPTFCVSKGGPMSYSADSVANNAFSSRSPNAGGKSRPKLFCVDKSQRIVTLRGNIEATPYAMSVPGTRRTRSLTATNSMLSQKIASVYGEGRPQMEKSVMPNIETALLVIDVQESFRYRPYWADSDVSFFIENLQALVDGAKSRNMPVVQIFHVEDSGPFSLASGHVVSFQGLSFEPDAVFYKRSHSALVGSGLDVWLIRNGIRRVIVCGIRTEQCCETTARHASDSGYSVDYVTNATLTFPMIDRHGREWCPDEIKARSELVLDGRFARVVSVGEALVGCAEHLVG